MVGGIDAHYVSFENLEPPTVKYVMTERMDDWKPPESWQRITCIKMIHTGHKNKEIMVVAQCTMNTVKTIRHGVENCDGDYEAVARRKQHSRRSDRVCRAESQSEKVMEDPGIVIRALSCELNVSASTMKLALNEDLRYYSYKCSIDQLLTEKACQNRLTKGKKLLCKVKHPAESQTIWFFSDEKNTKLRIIDGLHTVQRTLLVS